MRRFVLLVVFAVFALLLLLAPLVSAQDFIFATDFDDGEPELLVLDGDGDDIDFDLVEDDGDSFIEVTTDDSAFLYLEDAYDLVDYSLEITARIEGGLLWVTGRSGGDGCSGYDALVDAPDGEIYFYITDENCDYADELGYNDDVGLEEGEWFTLRLDMEGEDLTVSLNGEVVFTATDDTFTEGEPQMSFQPASNVAKGDAILQISSVFVTELGGGAGGDGVGIRSGSNDDEVASFNPNGDQEDILADLQAMDVVPSNGEFLFGEDYAYFFGQGSWFTSLARRSPSRDVVIAGDLTFTFERADEFQNCALMAHVNTDSQGTTTQQLEGGFDADGFAYIFDAASFEDEEFEFYSVDFDIESGQEYHVLLAVFGGNASLFVDGEPLIVREKVDDREGTFGIGLIGETADAGCEGRDIWAWSFD